MGALIFHILLVVAFWIAEQDLSAVPKAEEAILLDFTAPDKEPEPTQEEKKENLDNSADANQRSSSVSNRAVNDAAPRDKFFDKSYQQDIEEAKKLVADVNNQLSKKASAIKKIRMPEITTEGQSRDSIKIVVYSGKSNIHYFLKDRFHVRLPIPVYLAKGGGQVVVDIQVDRDGRVVKAQARSAANLHDPMLPQYALEAAERTVFNADAKAPAIQKGTITYNFVAQ
jgi:TonB family protein